MSLLNESFQLASQFSECNEAALIPLPRAVACELVLVSVLAPVEVSDIAVPYDPVLYATDASEDRGAIVHTEVGEDLVRLLSKVCKTKGAYTRLQSPWERLMQKVGLHDELPDELQSVAADRPLAYTFEFVEIFAGSSRVTAALQQLGIVCGPPIDLSKAEEYNMSHVFVLSWLYHLVERGTLRAFMLEPPCTTFSIMRRPALRDIDQPYGFDPRDPQTRDGNILACRSLQLMHKAAVRRVSGIMERPFTAKTRHLPPYRALLRRQAVSEVRCDSCQFGSIHQKSFALLGVNIDLSQLAKRCQGKCNHAPVSGVFTKASAIYTPELSAALAWTFQHALQWVGDSDSWRSSIVTEGLENQLVNEVMLSSCWSLSNSWKFKNKQRINLLEMRSVEKLVEKQAKKGPRRFCCLVDSNVCRGALGKGRSASLALSSVLRRISACQVTFGLYLTTPFCPTRLNIADDPTRERELRQPVVGCGWKTMSKQELWDIAMLPRLRRWASNWLRLMLLLLGASLKSWSDRSSFRLSRITEPVLFGQGQPCPSCPDIDYSCFEFDAAMGYPGEGPARLITNFIVFLCIAGSCLEFPSLSH